MAIIKLDEPYSVTLLRNQVLDSLRYHGEEAIALSLVHPEEADDRGNDPNAPRCPRCVNAAYQTGENDCPVCFGVSYVDPVNGTGVKTAKRVWAEFTDQQMVESLGQRGVWAPDAREVQLEAFPLLMEHDVIVRVRHWDIATHTPLVRGEFYGVQAVTRNSLRTGGNRYGQTRDDVIGQKAQCTLLSRSVGITNYPIKGVAFPDVGIIGTPLPVVVAEPDTKVVFVPTTDGGPPSPTSGNVLGASMEWKAVFTFTQPVPATTWTITHSLDHRPQCTVYVDDEIVLADVDTDEPFVVTITFGAPQAGYVELS
jgi:hypothetical protein